MHEPLPSSLYRYPVELNELLSVDRMLFVYGGTYASRAGYRAAAESTATTGNRSGAPGGSARARHQLEFEYDDNYHDYKPVGVGAASGSRS